MRLRTRLFLVSATAATIAVVGTLVYRLLVIFSEPIPDGVGSVSVDLRPLLYSTGVGFVLAIGASAILAWIGSRTVGARMSEIVGMANRLSAGDLNSRVRDGRQDEFGELGRALDEAVQSLGQRVGELARDRARMEAILGGMVEGVLVVSAQGQVQLVNDAARTMLRLDDTAIGRRYVELIRHPDIVGQLDRALGGETPGGVELSLGRDLSTTLIARAAPVTASGSTGAVLVLHDITDLRRADRIRRDFVANVSHELRTPLTAIRGYVEALLDAPPKPEETRRFLEIIARHSSRMERLVKDLLRLARLDAGQEVLDRAPCQVEGVFAGVIGDLTPAIEGRGQRVDVRVSPDASTVVGDPAKLHDVLRNLVENASNYSPEGSRIGLSADVDPSDVVIRVVDSGPGIPAADLSRVFERFYRVDKDRSRESGGTGLGLSIVRHLVELHGGQVEAANRAEGGAVFTVRLPRQS
jgi:two-component system, OmpR family, phosphate regulon sensor histidine kinase PhoR